MALGSLILRIAVGGLLAGHGLQKLRGAFGGPGIEGTVGMTKALGLHPPEVQARAIAWSETAGGAAIAVGALTPLAAAANIAGQLVALRKVHLPKGLWNAAGGYEYNAVLLAALSAIALDGPGAISFDALVRRARWGLPVGLAAVAGGVAASYAVTALGGRLAPDDDGGTPEEAQEDAAPSAGPAV